MILSKRRLLAASALTLIAAAAAMGGQALAGPKDGTASAKGLGPKGVRVLSVAPGWIYTTAAEAMVKRIAEHGGISEEAARQQIAHIDAPSPRP